MEQKKPHKNVSGSFQIIEDDRKEEIKDSKNHHDLDEESLYYARIFMED